MLQAPEAGVAVVGKVCKLGWDGMMRHVRVPPYVSSAPLDCLSLLVIINLYSLLRLGQTLQMQAAEMINY